MATGATRATPRLRAELTPWSGDIEDEADISDAVIVGDLSARDVSAVDWTGCRFEGVGLVGAHLHLSRLVDCVLSACDLSGLVFEEGSCTRVEFRDCRLSGIEAAGGRFRDVAFLDCRLDDANFRMARFERGEFDGCSLVDADFSSAVLPGSRFAGCDLAGARLSKSTLAGSRFERTGMERITGADALRGITIGSEQVLPVALALFAELSVDIDDGP